MSLTELILMKRLVNCLLFLNIEISNLTTDKETGGAPFMMPPEFRIIGTMNTQDKKYIIQRWFCSNATFCFC